MQVTSANYLEDGSIEAVIDGVTWFVPDDSQNRFRQAIAAWEAAGNSISPPPV